VRRQDLGGQKSSQGVSVSSCHPEERMAGRTLSFFSRAAYATQCNLLGRDSLRISNVSFQDRFFVPQNDITASPLLPSSFPLPSGLGGAVSSP